MSKRTRCRQSIGVSLLALGISGALYAQQPQADPEAVRTFDTVVVTGTNLRGAEPAGNEVLVIDAEEIQASGKATIGDFLRELPANFAGDRKSTRLNSSH